MEKVSTSIQYRTKIKTTSSGEEFFIPKKNISRHDVNLKPHEHWAYNSDLFNQILGRAHTNAIKERSVLWIATLPEGVSVEREGFLAKISVNVLI